MRGHFIFIKMEKEIKKQVEREYTIENLKTDIDWFDGLGIIEDEAISYIRMLLNSKPSEKLNSYLVANRL